MKKRYTRPSVDVWHITKTTSLLETLSNKGTVEEWIQEDTEMDESNYF